MSLMKWWFNRKPYVPAILKLPVEGLPPDPAMDAATKDANMRADLSVSQARNATASVVALHGQLLRLIEGGKSERFLQPGSDRY